MLKFSNDTRYKNVDSASVLSDLVLEKLLASGKFNFVETNPIDENIEAKLYDAKVRELTEVTNSMSSGNLNALFEGPTFDSMQAQTIKNADVGQIISPEITSEIGREHNAEYILQGNVIRLGSGEWYVGRAGEITEQSKAGIAIEVDLRLIKTDTGKVVWRKNVTGKKEKTKTSVMLPFLDKYAKLNSEMYSKAMEDAAKKIVDVMLKDLDDNKLFGE